MNKFRSRWSRPTNAEATPPSRSWWYDHVAVDLSEEVAEPDTGPSNVLWLEVGNRIRGFIVVGLEAAPEKDARYSRTLEGSVVRAVARDPVAHGDLVPHLVVH